MSALIAIDLSMRCAGLVALSQDGALLGQTVIPTIKEEYEGEFLLIFMEAQILNFAAKFRPTAVVIEGLAFNSKSGNTDLIAGNWWNIRKELRLQYAGAQFGSIPVTTWRSKVLDLSKAGKAELEAKYGKTYLKEGVRDKTPEAVLQKFREYLDAVTWPPKYPAAKKREAIFDLCDAYWLGQHRLRIGSI